MVNGKPLNVELGDHIGDLAYILRHNFPFMIVFRLLGQRVWSIFTGPQYRSLRQRGDNLLTLFN
jgi:hypothetical protein